MIHTKRAILFLAIFFAMGLYRTLSALPTDHSREAKHSVSTWLDGNMHGFRQKYTLSCEIALVRVSLAIAGISDVTEDGILATIPKGSDPETAFVCDNINAGRKNKDGSIHWNNYGTHAPVVSNAINEYLKKGGKADAWVAKELVADDARLKKLIADDPDFMGAIVWVVGHPERWGSHPPVNERGMVLGEHVRFVAPELSPNGEFRIHDPENGKRTDAPSSGASRDLFSYRIVGLFAQHENRDSKALEEKKNSTDGSAGAQKIGRGIPPKGSRADFMIALGNVIKASLSPKSDARSFALLILCALAYGVLHALGPGHQKTLVSGYLLSEGGGPGTAIAAAGIASLSHALSVTCLFAALIVLGSGFGLMDVVNAGRLVTQVSGTLLVSLASIMVWRKTAVLIGVIRNQGENNEDCGCLHRHRDNENDSHTERKEAKKGAIPLLISGSLAPCPGAAVFLLYGFHEGNAFAGVIAVAAISLGMWATLIAVGLASVAIRSAGTAKANWRKYSLMKYVPSAFGVFGSCAVLAIALYTVFPS